MRVHTSAHVISLHHRDSCAIDPSANPARRRHAHAQRQIPASNHHVLMATAPTHGQTPTPATPQSGSSQHAKAALTSQCGHTNFPHLLDRSANKSLSKRPIYIFPYITNTPPSRPDPMSHTNQFLVKTGFGQNNLFGHTSWSELNTGQTNHLVKFLFWSKSILDGIWIQCALGRERGTGRDACL